MKQKILCVIMCFILTAGCMSALADSAMSVNAAYNSQTDIIEINIEGDGLITVIIPQKGDSLTDVSDDNLPIYYNIMKADERAVLLKYELPANFDGGTYTVFATDESGHTANDSVIVPSMQTDTTLADKLNNAASYEELSGIIDENSDSLGIDTTDEYLVQNKDRISEIILSFDESFETVKDFYFLYHKAYAIASLKGATADETEKILKENKIYTGLDSQSDYKTYEYVAEGAKEALDKLLAESDFAALIGKNEDKDFKKVYEELRFIAEVSSSADRHTLQKIITESYKDFLSPEDNSQYKALNYPDAVFSEMLSYNLTDFDKIKSAFENCVTDAYDNENPPSSGRPSSGGGGGGGSVGGGITLPAPAEKVENEKTEESKPTFDDVDSSHWAISPITALASKGIINGYGSDFAPDNSITRAEFVTIICRAFRVTTEKTDAEFTDVSKNEWFYEYVQKASGAGIILGDGNGTFRPNDSITRQDACVIINRAISAYGIELKPGKAVSFDDKNNIALYALSDISILFANGVVKGTSDTTFEPEAQITRAQTAQLIYNAMDNIKILDLI